MSLIPLNCIRLMSWEYCFLEARVQFIKDKLIPLHLPLNAFGIFWVEAVSILPHFLRPLPYHLYPQTKFLPLSFMLLGFHRTVSKNQIFIYWSLNIALPELRIEFLVLNKCLFETTKYSTVVGKRVIFRVYLMLQLCVAFILCSVYVLLRYTALIFTRFNRRQHIGMWVLIQLNWYLIMLVCAW